LKPIKITIPGRVKSKQSTTFGGGHAFTDPKIELYESYVRLCYMEQTKPYSEQRMIGGPISLDIFVFFAIPKSKSKKLKEEMKTNKLRPMITPDWDNIAKIVCDGLENVAFGDDKQIVEGSVKKYYDDEARVELILKKLD